MRHALPSSRTVFIEHYETGESPVRPGPTFDLVTFSREEPEAIWSGCRRWMPTLGEPDWLPLDRETVERLVGRRLEDP